jgi:hypothetical protein
MGGRKSLEGFAGSWPTKSGTGKSLERDRKRC